MPEQGRIIDLFAGAGGWEEGLMAHGLHATGVELDQAACRTAVAAGHERIVADVAALEPASFGDVWGLIASPPCQAYSLAGRGLGRRDQPHVVACAHELAAGHDTRAARRARCEDDRSLLTVEPLRWALTLRPRWIALEQVPPVMELWSLFAELLAAHGYETAVGVLSAERYGVAQTRKRAYLIASLDGPVRLPAPTHRFYDPRRPQHVRDDERHLPSWVSMADALGWTADAVVRTQRPTHDGRDPQGLTRATDCPSFTVLSSTRAWTVEPCAPRGTSGPNARTRRPVGYDSRQTGCRVRPTAEPAPTLLASGLAKGTPTWVFRRPATTVLGDRRVQPPGHKRNARDRAGRYQTRAGKQAVRVTVEQATRLQGFRPDYPWQGSPTAQFRQIGNAVCPPLVRLVLGEAMRSSQPDAGATDA